MVITLLSDYLGAYPFRDCTCAHGILVLVWALAPNSLGPVGRSSELPGICIGEEEG